jgi:hypothetical protein
LDKARLRPVWSKTAFRERSRNEFGGCRIRDLYHYLVNIEFFPHILPQAEKFARDRLQRSMAHLRGAIRPIPSESYDPEKLDEWVHTKHREQIDSYVPIERSANLSKKDFVSGTLQLAPLILIDGGWLQNVTHACLIHTQIGRTLFRIFYEELGEGDPTLHHANVYRDLLLAMGEDVPPVESIEFAHWPRLQDSSFEIPALWLSISCFPRHFMPEILGLNLAVELAGVGGPYMEARDTLRLFNYPTLFVELHNAADNVASGHSAQARDAIKMYMDDLAVREGPHSLNQAWRRIWCGICSTLPQVSSARLWEHRIRQRLDDSLTSGVPTIFPT